MSISSLDGGKEENRGKRFKLGYGISKRGAEYSPAFA